MKKGIILLGSLLLVSSTLLAACSSGGSDSANSATPQGNDAAQTAAAAQPLTRLVEASDLTKLPDVSKKRNDTIIVALTDPAGVFTPFFNQSGYDGNVISQLWTPLITVDDKGLPIPNLAKSWDISKDNLIYTFHLVPDTKFSDGSPLTAEDVAFTWTLIYDKAYAGDSKILDLGIKGGKDYTEGKAKQIEGIKVIDPQTISVTLEKPNALALPILGDNVLSKAYYGKDYKFGQLDYLKKLHGSPLGNGAYKLEKFIPGQEVRLEANDNFFKGKPKTQHFIYKTAEGDAWQFIETGDTDFAPFTATQENIDKLKGLGFLNILPYTPSTYGYIQLNLENEKLKDKKVRQALTYGLDRKTIYVDAAQGAGAVANIPSSPIFWSYTTDGVNPYNYDPEKAKKLLDEAGWVAGSNGIREKNGQKLTIHMLTSKRPETDTFIALAAENYKEIGVDFQPEIFADFNAMVAKVDGKDYDMASFSTPMLTDPSDGIEQFVDGEIKGYNNPKVKELYEKGLSTTNIEERKKIYKELYLLLNDELPVIFTNYKKTVYAYNGRMEHVKVSPFIGLSGNLFEWSLK
ncbi:peptide ABC transporter periplasmic protein [Paenibacillus terrae HPL-003]|uniref:Peptide ABC transporter periplasmic protein n=1 Tax=Paenibacillus terrae (strain HPL-003) TaxID=985665 RepID=G7W2U2_PAETH|nr:ABC transporter substrate-binding protein [Paenibacillus terrae]AET60598.1 peptide ABC transporter periplasmic protein [Paenibacillus terrae HPL-003]